MIVIDDGSSDNTGDVVRVYSNIDLRISYHYSENQGAAMARNYGCSFASGKYFTFLDSDDEYLPEHLSTRAKMISIQPEIELIHGNVEVIGNPMVADRFDLTKLIPISECIAGGTFFIRRDLFNRLDGFAGIPYSDDNDFFSRARELGALISKVDRATYRYYRNEPDSLCGIAATDGIAGIEKLRGNA